MLVFKKSLSSKWLSNEKKEKVVDAINGGSKDAKVFKIFLSIESNAKKKTIPNEFQYDANLELKKKVQLQTEVEGMETKSEQEREKEMSSEI